MKGGGAFGDGLNTITNHNIGRPEGGGFLRSTDFGTRKIFYDNRTKVLA
jgi:hypothetical protein